MKVELYKIDAEKLCFVTVNRDEALRLIRSLTNQLIDKSPNAGRLESRCRCGDATEFSIAVME
jgi:hypothetical protein